MLEIKTSEEIRESLSYKTKDKKWVSVESVLKELNDCTSGTSNHLPRLLDVMTKLKTD